MSDIMRSLNVDGIPSYQTYGEIARRFFDLKNDHELEFYDEDYDEVIPCLICEKEYTSWQGAFRSHDLFSVLRDITIRF